MIVGYFSEIQIGRSRLRFVLSISFVSEQSLTSVSIRCFSIGCINFGAISANGISTKFLCSISLCGTFNSFEKIKTGKGICLKTGTKVAILSIGTIAKNVNAALELIENKDDFSHYDLRFIKPLDENLLHQIFDKYQTIITVEDGIVKGGFGSSILEFASNNNYTNKVELIGILDEFIEHGTISKLQHKIGLNAQSLAIRFQLYS